MPKTGGTFVHGVFKKIIKKYKKEHPIKWYLNRFGYKLNLVTPIYQKLIDVSYYEYPNDNVIGQHAGASFIPLEYKKLPIISVKRDPIKKFISSYYYRWWERFPSLTSTQLKELFPHYPEISIEEFFTLANNHVMKNFFGADFRADIGVLSWQFIRMYSTNPIHVYNNITKANYSEFIETYFVKVEFFEMNQLSSEFETYIKGTGFSEYSDDFLTEERIYPPGSNIKNKPEPVSEVLSEKIKSKEWILYEFFPEYNL